MSAIDGSKPDMTSGVAMGRNPNGAVRDISSRYRVLNDVPQARAGLLVTIVLAAGLAVGDTIDGWTLTIVLAFALVVWPQAAELVMARRNPKETGGGLEWAGVERPLEEADVHALDARLGLEEVPA